MEKCNQSEKAVEYIANQIEKLEKNVNEYNYNINSIELELNALCNKMDEIINKAIKLRNCLIQPMLIISKKKNITVSKIKNRSWKG